MGGVGSGPAPAGEPVEVGTVLQAAPQPPAHLSHGARDVWVTYAQLVVDAGLLRSADLLSFELMCNAGARSVEAAAMVEHEGTTTTGSRDQIVEHPAVGTERQSQSLFLKWADKFGLTPGSRARLRGAPKGDPGDDMDEFNAGPTAGGG